MMPVSIVAKTVLGNISAIATWTAKQNQNNIMIVTYSFDRFPINCPGKFVNFGQIELN